MEACRLEILQSTEVDPRASLLSNDLTLPASAVFMTSTRSQTVFLDRAAPPAELDKTVARKFSHISKPDTTEDHLFLLILQVVLLTL